MHYTHVQASERMQFLDRVLPRFERRHRVAITLSLIALDVILLWFAFWSAYELRYGYELGGNIFAWDRQSFSAFYGRAALFVLFCLASFAIRGVYHLPKWATFLDEAMLIAGAVTVAMGGVILTNYLSQFSPSRLVFVYAWVLSISYLLVFRLLRRGVRQALWQRSIGVERVLVVGSGDVGRRIIQAVIAAPDAGLRIAGFVDEPGQQRMLTVGSEQGVLAPQRLGAIADVPAVLGRHRIDQVIIAVGGDHHDQIVKISDYCHAVAIPFHIVPDLLQLSFDRAELSELAGVPLLGVRQAAIVGVSAAVKRTFDLALAVLLLTISAIPLAIAWILWKRSGTACFFLRSERVGRNGELFDRLGLTSTATGREKEAATRGSACALGEARFGSIPISVQVTSDLAGEGRWLVGQIPLLLNVFRGEVSFVGPLAQQRSEVNRYEEWHLQRLRATPGLTGLWAVQGRQDLTFDEMVRLDLFYAEHWSLWLDVKILLRSIPVLWSKLDAA